MSDEPQQGVPPAGDPGQAPGEPELTAEQEQVLRQMEEEMRRVRVQDLLVQSVVSILNLSARRIAKEDERDLEQARVGIEAVRALVDMLEPEAQTEVRNALSQIQMLYAQEAGGGAESGGGEPPPGGGGAPQPAPGQQGPGGEPPSRLWTPGSG
jgi:hypothetical protein